MVRISTVKVKKNMKLWRLKLNEEKETKEIQDHQTLKYANSDKSEWIKLCENEDLVN